MQILGERLKALREGMKLSQQKVADMIGCPQTSIYRYENGTYTPSAEALLWYADYFDVSLEYILGRTNKPQGKWSFYFLRFWLTQALLCDIINTQNKYCKRNQLSAEEVGSFML